MFPPINKSLSTSNISLHLFLFVYFEKKTTMETTMKIMRMKWDSWRSRIRKRLDEGNKRKRELSMTANITNEYIYKSNAFQLLFHWTLSTLLYIFISFLSVGIYLLSDDDDPALMGHIKINSCSHFVPMSFGKKEGNGRRRWNTGKPTDLKERQIHTGISFVRTKSQRCITILKEHFDGQISSNDLSERYANKKKLNGYE